MLPVIIRTIILYALVFLAMRLMGKRQLAQLQPYELAVAIMISALAAIPMEDISIPLVNSIIPILILLSFQILVSMISLKFEVPALFVWKTQYCSRKRQAGGKRTKEPAC